MTCPRCGVPFDQSEGRESIVIPANRTLICRDCGQAEAASLNHGAPPIPPNEWPITPAQAGDERAAFVESWQRNPLPGGRA